jgi:hypothetical protein
MENSAANKSTCSIALKLGVFVSMVIGVASTAGSQGFMHKGTSFLYFTIQSNLCIGGICLVFALLLVIGRFTNRSYIKNWMITLKFIFSVAISLTFIVMLLLLTPKMIASGQTAYLSTASNIFCHYATPLLAMMDFVFFDIAWRSRWRDAFYAVVMPFYYLIFAYTCSFNGVVFSGNEKVPYFFMNYDKLTWFRFTSNGPGVFWWILFLTIAVIAMGFGLVALNKRMKKTRFAERGNPT